LAEDIKERDADGSSESKGGERVPGLEVAKKVPQEAKGGTVKGSDVKTATVALEVAKGVSNNPFDSVNRNSAGMTAESSKESTEGTQQEMTVATVSKLANIVVTSDSNDDGKTGGSSESKVALIEVVDELLSEEEDVVVSKLATAKPNPNDPANKGDTMKYRQGEVDSTEPANLQKKSPPDNLVCINNNALGIEDKKYTVSYVYMEISAEDSSLGITLIVPGEDEVIPPLFTGNTLVTGCLVQEVIAGGLCGKAGIEKDDWLVLLKDPSCRDSVPKLRCSTTEKVIQAMLHDGAQLLSFCVIRKNPNNSVTDAATDVQAASSAKSQGQSATRKRSQVDRFQPEESKGSSSPRRKRKSSSSNSDKKNSAVADSSQGSSITLSESSRILQFTQDPVDDADKTMEKEKAPESKPSSKHDHKKQKVGTPTATSSTFENRESQEGTLSNKKATDDTKDQEVCQAWDFTKEECNTFNESAEQCKASKTEEKATTALDLEEFVWAHSISFSRMMRQYRQIKRGDAPLSRLEDWKDVKLSESELKECREMMDYMSRKDEYLQTEEGKKQWDSDWSESAATIFKASCTKKPPEETEQDSGTEAATVVEAKQAS
jgi:hypothetical protein